MTTGKVDDTFDSSELEGWVRRLQIQRVTSDQPGGSPLHRFVRGLMFSSKLVDYAEDHLPDGFRADWGQVMDDDGTLLSPESDVIIYTGKARHRFKSRRTMDYAIIPASQARLLIQCRAVLSSVTKELREYLERSRRFCPRIWLFVECCWAKDDKQRAHLAKQVRKAGFEKFFYLYRCIPPQQPVVDLHGWQRFIKLVRSFE